MITSPFPRMHVSLYVTDINATVAFYTALFGQGPSKVRPAYAKFTLERPSLIISFVENPELVRPHFGHLGFQVETPAQLDGLRAQAEAKGLLPRDEKGTVCCYAEQDKFWVADPDGVQWEVYYFKADAEFNHPPAQDAGAAACCAMPESAAPAKSALAALAAMPLASNLETERAAGGACCTPEATTAEAACC